MSVPHYETFLQSLKSEPNGKLLIDLIELVPPRTNTAKNLVCQKEFIEFDIMAHSQVIPDGCYAHRLVGKFITTARKWYRCYQRYAVWSRHFVPRITVHRFALCLFWNWLTKYFHQMIIRLPLSLLTKPRNSRTLHQSFSSSCCFHPFTTVNKESHHAY